MTALFWEPSYVTELDTRLTRGEHCGTHLLVISLSAHNFLFFSAAREKERCCRNGGNIRKDVEMNMRDIDRK